MTPLQMYWPSAQELLLLSASVAGHTVLEVEVRLMLQSETLRY